MMSGVPLETCWVLNKLWNNKFYYKLHLVGISIESYYDARMDENQIYKRGVRNPYRILEDRENFTDQSVYDRILF
jgi:hypothetical protein